jgi:adenine/guanine phosphoribosyltransferase-like PRPP-binding protein
VLHRDRQRVTVRKALKALRGKKFDAIAFRGLSGTLIGPLLAFKLNRTMLAVRKRKREGHSGLMVEGDRGARTYIIVDDFIQTARTVRSIIEEVKDFTDDEAQCVGVYLTSYPKMGLQKTDMLKKRYSL